MRRPTIAQFFGSLTLGSLILAAPLPAAAQTTAEGCNLTGSPNVFIEGRPALRLGDVTGCPGLRYEIIPGMMVNGQPAVRILPSEDCTADGADSVLVDGAPASRQGDAACGGN